ncbi:MAG: serine/threonine protein kinase, partial [Myxococcota bacterium]
MTAIPLAPFVLNAMISRGGMGEVWAGHHAEQGVAVAIKILSAEGTRQPMFVQAFRREVRSVARLSHPGIVIVFDYGTITAAAAARSGGRLVTGSPYLVMELAGSGTLSEQCGSID